MTAKRRVCYLSGTRADFGLMVPTLRLIQQRSTLDLSLLVTGMHLSEQFGLTVREIEAEGFEILARMPCEFVSATGAQMARNIGSMLLGFVDVLEASPPDVLLVLGDRGEMLAGALAAIHLGIPVVHIHGGERSGTIDESIRHAISKLAHWHMVATQESRDRLVRMGEKEEQVLVVGAPGLDGLRELASISRDELCSESGIEPGGKIALLVFHPVLYEAEAAGQQVRTTAQTAMDCGYQVVALMPNADAGNTSIREVLMGLQEPGRFIVKTHLSRQMFVSWLACVDALIGNSSSGIIEAATFGTPVVNLGSRQNMRERNDNVIDTPIEASAIRRALGVCAGQQRKSKPNRYGDGLAGTRITDFLVRIDLSCGQQAKCNAY